MLLFGGESPQGEALRDTWAFDGNAWTLLDALGPANAALPLLVSDPAISACCWNGPPGWLTETSSSASRSPSP